MFEVIQLGNTGSVIYKRISHRDSRGRFSKVFSIDQLSPEDFGLNIAQVNFSITEKKGAIRGLHFQEPFLEDKYVICLTGAIHQVALDIDPGGEKFRSLDEFTIDSDDNLVTYVPGGVAHGFQALSDSTSLLYLHTTVYDQNKDKGYCPIDQSLGISWPLPVSIISTKDQKAPLCPR